MTIISRLFRFALKHGNLIFTALAATATIASAIFFYESLHYSSESIRLALKLYERGVESRVSGRYSFVDNEEYFVLRNLGPGPIGRIIARRDPFFVFRTNVQSANGLSDSLRRDASMIEGLRSSGILTRADQFDDLMGPVREFSIERLGEGEESQLEVSQFSNSNAIKLAGGLGAIFVVRWRISFESGPDQKPTSQILDYWVGDSNTRENLTNVFWGENISMRLTEASRHLADFIFAEAERRNHRKPERIEKMGSRLLRKSLPQSSQISNERKTP